MTSGSGLSKRKKLILRAVIDDYIKTAEPIGSRSVSKRHELSLSSATIRNEMADLEELGYLEQPHTSAGRVPSDLGYRFYVDQLMEVKLPTFQEIESIRSALEIQINELSQLIKQASNVMSRITRYTSMAMAPRMKKETLKAIQVVPIEQGRALVIGVTNAGIVKNVMVNISKDIRPETLIRVSNILNEKLSGLTIECLDIDKVKEIGEELGMAYDLLSPVIKGVIDCIRQIDVSEVYLNGATNILNYPEFSNIVKAKEFLLMLDEKELLQRLLDDVTSNKIININIGHENKLDEVKDCTLILTSYKIGKSVTGTLGIIGPTRMNYSKVISSINYIRKKIDEEIKKHVGEEF